MHRWLRGSRVPLSLLVVALLAGGTLLLAPTDPPESATAPAVEAEAAPAALPPGTAGMRYTLEPEGGALEGAATGALELDEETRNALRRDEEGLVPVTHPDGSVSIHLQGRYQSASVAHRGADGTVTVCVDDAHAVTPAPAPASTWEVQ